MRCIYCDVEIESDDNFCWKCGHWTAKGYSFFKNEENINLILNSDVGKQNERFSILISLLGIGVVLFAFMMLFRGDDLFKPFIYLKKQVTNYVYGYNTSIIKTNNKYNSVEINTYEEGIKFIKKDFDEQSWLCENDIEILQIEYEFEEKFNIPSVSFCDISYDVAIKLREVISSMYDLFSTIKGSLTNITITNASSSEYIAYFQPLYQFVNINENIKNFNKVNSV